MVTINAEGTFQETIKRYLDENASESLTERINAGTKTMAECANYIISQAKKKAMNGCAVIEDATVFGWAIHFFEEDSIKGSDYKKASAGSRVTTSAPVKTEKADAAQPVIKKPEPKREVKEKKTAPEAQLPGQMSIFDLMMEG